MSNTVSQEVDESMTTLMMMTLITEKGNVGSFY